MTIVVDYRWFFRRHYLIDTVTFCGIDARDRRLTIFSLIFVSYAILIHSG